MIPLRNVSEARAVMPLLLRFFDVGSVVVSTNDGSMRTLFNVKDPDIVAGNVRPAGDVVTRPSVG